MVVERIRRRGVAAAVRYCIKMSYFQFSGSSERDGISLAHDGVLLELSAGLSKIGTVVAAPAFLASERA